MEDIVSCSPGGFVFYQVFASAFFTRVNLNLHDVRTCLHVVTYVVGKVFIFGYSEIRRTKKKKGSR